MDIENKQLPPEHWKNLSLVDIEGEEWKDIVGYEGLYQISNMGRIKSLPRFHKNGNGGYYTKLRILRQHKRGKNYLYIFFGSTKTNFLVHRLVAQHFVLNPNNKPFVNHKWGIVWDNRHTELEWMTNQENCQHAFDIGIHIPQKGENASPAKLTQQQANEIRSKYKPTIYTIKMLSKEYLVSTSAIGCIIYNKSYL